MGAMQRADLEALARAQLQALAKTNGIKANLSSAQILRQLELKSVPSVDGSRSTRAKRTTRTAVGTRAVATAAATPTTRRGRKTTQEHVPSKAPAAIVVLPQPAPTSVTVVTRRKRKVQAADLEVDHNDDSARRTRRKLNPPPAPSPAPSTVKPAQTRTTARKTGTKRKTVTIDTVAVPVVEAPPPSPRATSEDSVNSDASELFSDSAEQTVDSAATTPDKDLFTKSSGSTPSPPLAVTSLPELDAVLQKAFSPEPVAQPVPQVEVDSSVPVIGPVDDSSAPIASTSALPIELATITPEDLSSTQIDTPTTSEPAVSSDPLDTATSLPSAPAPEGELTAAAALQLARDELFGQLGADRRPDSSARRTGRDAEWLADSRFPWKTSVPEYPSALGRAARESYRMEAVRQKLAFIEERRVRGESKEWDEDTELLCAAGIYFSPEPPRKVKSHSATNPFGLCGAATECLVAGLKRGGLRVAVCGSNVGRFFKNTIVPARRPKHLVREAMTEERKVLGLSHDDEEDHDMEEVVIELENDADDDEDADADADGEFEFETVWDASQPVTPAAPAPATGQHTEAAQAAQILVGMASNSQPPSTSPQPFPAASASYADTTFDLPMQYEHTATTYSGPSTSTTYDAFGQPIVATEQQQQQQAQLGDFFGAQYYTYQQDGSFAIQTASTGFEQSYSTVDVSVGNQVFTAHQEPQQVFGAQQQVFSAHQDVSHQVFTSHHDQSQQLFGHQESTYIDPQMTQLSWNAYQPQQVYDQQTGYGQQTSQSQQSQQQSEQTQYLPDQNQSFFEPGGPYEAAPPTPRAAGETAFGDGMEMMQLDADADVDEYAMTIELEASMGGQQQQIPLSQSHLAHLAASRDKDGLLPAIPLVRSNPGYFGFPEGWVGEGRPGPETIVRMPRLHGIPRPLGVKAESTSDSLAHDLYDAWSAAHLAASRLASFPSPFPHPYTVPPSQRTAIVRPTYRLRERDGKWEEEKRVALVGAERWDGYAAFYEVAREKAEKRWTTVIRGRKYVRD